MDGDSLRIVLVLVALCGFVITVATTGAFALRLRRAHPELWSSYQSLFWTFPGESRSERLRVLVYSRISDRLTRFLLVIMQIGFVAYILLTFGAVLLFALTLAHL
jgi:hypothetical protein